MDRWVIGRADFEMERFYSSSTTELNIKFHQFLAHTQLPVIRAHTDIEKLGLLGYISETYETHHRRYGSIACLHNKTTGKRISHLSDEHILRPEGEGVGALQGNDLLQFLEVHLLNGHLFQLHGNATRFEFKVKRLGISFGLVIQVFYKGAFIGDEACLKTTIL